MLSGFEHEKSFITSGPGRKAARTSFYGQFWGFRWWCFCKDYFWLLLQIISNCSVSKVAIHEPKLNHIVSKPIWPNANQPSNSHYTPPLFFLTKLNRAPFSLSHCKKIPASDHPFKPTLVCRLEGSYHEK